MLNLLFQNMAVPFGYTAEMDASDYIYGDECVSAVERHWRLIHPDPRGAPELPDLVLSHTPPPSPLRRARSFQSFFPEKTTPAPSVAPSLETPPDSPAGEDGLRTGLQHIREVRRSLELAPPQPGPLPQLTWPLPRAPQPPQVAPQQPEASSDGPWRQVGRDLRRVADQFQQDNSKVGRKDGERGAEGGGGQNLNVTLPVALTRCLSASILFLVWWRLINRFH